MFFLNLHLNILGDSPQVNLLCLKKEVMELHVQKRKQWAADRFQKLESKVSINNGRRKWFSSIKSPFYLKQVHFKRKRVSADVPRLSFIKEWIAIRKRNIDKCPAFYHTSRTSVHKGSLIWMQWTAHPLLSPSTQPMHFLLLHYLSK